MSTVGDVGANIEQAYANMPGPLIATAAAVQEMITQTAAMAASLCGGAVARELHTLSDYPNQIGHLAETLETTHNQHGLAAIESAWPINGSVIEARRRALEIVPQLGALASQLQGLLEAVEGIDARRSASRQSAAKYLTEAGLPHRLDLAA